MLFCISVATAKLLLLPLPDCIKAQANWIYRALCPAIFGAPR